MEPNGNAPKQPVRPVNPAGAGAPRPVARQVVRPVMPRSAASRPVTSRPATPATPGVPAAPKPAEPTFDNGSSVVGKKERKTGWVLALMLLFIIAAGGVGFGVWAYLDSNTQKNQLNSQISDLQQQNAELQDDLSDGATSNGVVNPIITPNKTDEDYSVYFDSSEIMGDNGLVTSKLSISVNDGAIKDCYITRKSGDSSFETIECSVDGISGNIYKIAEFGSGQDNHRSNVGFIMEDGTVEYFPLYDIVDSNSLSSRGKIAVDGSVVDVMDVIVGVQVAPDEGHSYSSSIFMLDDGTFVVFDNSMLE